MSQATSFHSYCHEDDVWDRATAIKSGEVYLIAQDARNDIDIYVSRDDCTEAKSALVYVMDYGEIVYEETFYSQEECSEGVEKIYSEYILKGKLTDKEEIENVIAEREDWLDQAVLDFLDAVIGDDFQDYDSDTVGNLVEDCKEHFLEYLSRKHSVPICRPMYLEDENGKDYYSEYPYEEMEFDYEDNPIYKPDTQE